MGDYIGFRAWGLGFRFCTRHGYHFLIISFGCLMSELHFDARITRYFEEGVLLGSRGLSKYAYNHPP